MAAETHTFSYSTFRGSVEGVHTATFQVPASAGTDDQKLPVVVHFHGGFWKSQWGVHNLDTDALFAAFGNVATWNVEYARVDQSDPAASTAGGGWPHTCLDALAALNALATLTEPMRARLDLQRVYLCGHSAGAYLALWLGALSRLPPTDIERVAVAAGDLAGPQAAAAVRAGLSSELSVCGVVGLAPVASLAACAAAGLSDFHDAAANFMWRAGPSAAAAIASGQLGAACPLSLWCSLPTAAPAAPGGPNQEEAKEDGRQVAPLRVLLVHGLADTDVPATLSLSFASAIRSAAGAAAAAERTESPEPPPPPCWLLLVPSADHYVVAGLGVVPADADGPPGAPWPTIAAALRAFAAEDVGVLDGACCRAGEAEAERLVSQAEKASCARHTLGAIATAEPDFVRWADAEPASAASLARGLRRWLAWVGEAPAEATRAWINARTGGYPGV